MTNSLARRCIRLLRPDTSTQSEVADCELITRFVTSHDEAAFAELVLRHGDLIRGAARRVGMHTPRRT